jgi:hypothetical protein
MLDVSSLPLDLDAARQRNSEFYDGILYSLSTAEWKRSRILMWRNQFDASNGHCEKCLFYPKQCTVEKSTKTSLVLSALFNYCNLLNEQGDHIGAVTFAEEAYNYVAIAYNPVHPQMQEAASTLIHCLTLKGDFYDAERYAQLTLDSLTDPSTKVNQKSEQIAQGYANLAQVIYGHLWTI